MRTKFTLIVAMLFLAQWAMAYNNLLVSNPLNWRGYNGVIDSANITVRPLGAYVEYALTLTISAHQASWEDDNAQLEIVLNFDLPTNSMITDSWLWIEGKPKRADMLDRWTASNIYENIVKRRKDPSLLLKNGANQYSMNVYPMKVKESRTFKMVYISPAKTNGNKLSLELPTHILELSAVKLAKFTVHFLDSDLYTPPSSENTEIIFSRVTDGELGNHLKAEIPYSSFNNHQIKLESKSSDPLKVYQYGNADEGFYQISFVPSELIDQTESSQKICYLVDFDKNYTPQDVKQFMAQLSGYLQSSINKNDQFNIIFSNISPKTSFADWTTATPENIQQAFSQSSISQYSNYISLLGNGLEFINTHGNEGKLVLITNNCSQNNTVSANALLSDIQKLNVNKTRIDVIDYAPNYYTGTWLNNASYYNNSYFFINLTRKFTGEYLQLYQNNNNSRSFASFIDEALTLIAGKSLTNMDIYTSNAHGFCYGRMDLSSSIGKSYSFGKTVHHLGKYKGGFPSNFEIAFEMEGQLFHHQEDLTKYAANKTDSVLKTIWSGLDMFGLEAQGNSNQVINEIITQSLDNRILSYYTAFLCLEDGIVVDDPNMENNPDNDGNNGEVIISVDEMEKSNLITVSPNPFINFVTIELPTDDELVALKIYNTSGQCIKTITVKANVHTYTWDGTTDNGTAAQEGIYLVKATFKQSVVTTKMMKQ